MNRQATTPGTRNVPGLLRVIALSLTVILSACDTAARPPLEAHDINVFAPLPGSSMSVAYMVLENTTGDAINVDRFSSPEFAVVELHETVIANDIARMRKLDSLLIAARSSVALSEGGKHLMLMRPTSAVDVEENVTLRLGFGENGMVIVSAPLRSRIELEDSR